jgi:hypothetical protein
MDFIQHTLVHSRLAGQPYLRTERLPPLSVWQFDSVGMIIIASLIVGRNPFEPTSLFLGEPIIDQSLLVIDNELFGATVTTKGAHFSETHCVLPAVTLLYRNRMHLRHFFYRL